MVSLLVCLPMFPKGESLYAHVMSAQFSVTSEYLFCFWVRSTSSSCDSSVQRCVHSVPFVPFVPFCKFPPMTHPYGMPLRPAQLAVMRAGFVLARDSCRAVSGWSEDRLTWAIHNFAGSATGGLAVFFVAPPGTGGRYRVVGPVCGALRIFSVPCPLIRLCVCWLSFSSTSWLAGSSFVRGITPHLHGPPV